MTQIISNGSHWGGEQPDKISSLVSMLRAHPLDKTFEDFGNFAYKLNPQNCGDRKDDVGKWVISGNFLTYSHVFYIVTTNKPLVNLLRREIRANKQRPDYASR